MRDMTDRPVTLSDVAEAAGVSLSTASKALSGTDRISPKTRQLVRNTALELGFRPNALARSFAQGRSQTIGVLTQRASNVWSRVVLAGTALELGAADQAMLLYDARLNGADMADSVLDLRARRIDGVIVIGVGTSERVLSVSDLFQVPVVHAFMRTENENDVTVTSDDAAIGRVAVTHLIQSGRRRIAHITGSVHDEAANTRALGASEAMAEAGLEWATPVRFDRWSESWGERATTAVLVEVPDVDAIFCGSDAIARGAERALRAAGRRIPDDVALIGVDNWEQLMHEQFSRHLTTVEVGLEQIGRLAARHLIHNDLEPGTHFVAPEVKLGVTT
jgi:LacI family transcriptional regulator